ncbi:MAG TPA: vanadium-dependent haloperoxidase [Gammaproteobacteria bacterium]
MHALKKLAAGALAASVLVPPASSADVVTDWNGTMLATLAGQNPFAQARFAAITQLAVFEAVNAIERDYDPYLGTVKAPRHASAEAAAAAAAHGVLVHYFPGSADALDAALDASLAQVLPGAAKDAGVEVGRAAAAAMIDHRSNDGAAAAPRFHVPGAPVPGEWQATAGCPPAGGILVHWQDVLPFGIDSASQFRSPRPPSLRSAQYAKDFNELKRVGAKTSTDRPQDRADVAVFYNAALAPLVWNSVARQLAASRGTSLAHNARAFALLNMAMSDGLVSVMETKYVYNFWRPETALAAGDQDGNPKTSADASFEPFIPTPCFPSYGSAHAAASYAARAVLEEMYGHAPALLTLSTPAVPGIELTYRRLRDITDDIDDARVYGGIHFRFDQRAGAEQGMGIGRFVVRHNLQRRLPPGHGAVCRSGWGGHHGERRCGWDR